jgi:polyhydroxyalkanoate synthesis regulator phasin
MNNSEGKKFVQDMVYDIEKDMNERALNESLSQYDFESNEDEEEGYGLFKKGGFVSKAELVWKKLSSSDRMKFLQENFTPQITPISQEILVGKAYNFLPKEVKITLASKYADIEEYAEGGEAGEWKIGDKFRVLKGLYGDYNSPYYANQEFEVINIRDGKYIDAINKRGNTETFDSKNIEKISFVDGGGVGWNENALEELKEFEGDDEIQITTDSGDLFYASNDNAEYLVFKNYDDAYDYAYQMVNQDLVENPDYFNQDWLSNYIDIDGAENYLTEVFDEWNTSYANDIKMESDKNYSNRLISEMVNAGIMDDEDADSENAESMAENLIPEFVDYMTNEQIQDGRGGLKYYESNFGKEQTMKMIKENNLIDIDEATEGAISEDGVAHFISSYDGNEIELPSGYYAYRTN